MSSEFNKQKQESDEDRDPQNVKREGFTAEELGEASAYTDSTEMAQQMRRGDETKGNPNDRDTAGATPVSETNDMREDRDTVPREVKPDDSKT